MRKSRVHRKTKETDILVCLNLDGKQAGQDIRSSIAFMDHMLKLFAFQAGFGLTVRSRGDTEIDDHHLVEDLGLAVGSALKEALGDKKGINRYGNFLMPMDEALSYVVVDISGRPYLKYSVKLKPDFRWMKHEFNYTLIEDFFRALVSKAELTLHIKNTQGSNNHHIAESVFKGFGRALGQAARIDPKLRRVPSTKGRL